MATYDLSSTEAFQRLRNNEASRWTNVVTNANGCEIGSGFFAPHVTKKFAIDKNMSGYVLGSCFAQEVQLALGKLKVPLRSLISESPIQDWFMEDGKCFWPLHFFHRYNPPSMLQEFQSILGKSTAMRNGSLIFGGTDGLFRDYHYHSHFPLTSAQECIDRRHFVLERINALTDVNFVILTLGLIEAWFDVETGLYLNTTPRKELTLLHPERFRFHVLDERDIYTSVQKIIELLIELNANIKIIITVSPIPLDATFTGDDISIANTNSKATLLSAANRIVRDYANVMYFPSYEIVTLSDRSCAWASDGRHVLPEFVEKIMGLFCDEVVDGVSK